jgi:hypothetical protein
MKATQLSSISINRNGVLSEVQFSFITKRYRLIEGLKMDSIFDDIDESRICDLLKNTDGSRYINFKFLKNE